MKGFFLWFGWTNLCGELSFLMMIFVLYGEGEHGIHDVLVVGTNRLLTLKVGRCFAMMERKNASKAD